jgi:UDP-N-acetylmuramoyl-tripeptide--D-alanyl-D-alanine ligase
MIKKFAKQLVATVLGWQVRRLREKNDFKVVAVAGSIGKTSTKLAIAHVLSQAYKVRHQAGNYNDPVSVPLIYFGGELPNVFNPIAWLKIFRHNEQVLKQRYPFEIVVVELGTDRPGDMAMMAKYVRADIGVLTAITPEHMELFADLDAVAREELVLANISQKVFVNRDLVPKDYLPGGATTYAIKHVADVRLSNVHFNGDEAEFDVSGPTASLRARHQKITEPQLYSICAACMVAFELQMTPKAIGDGVATLKPVSGRMQHLEGINGATIIDDTYNASPEAMRAALDTLYRVKAPQKIAVLGNMNELGGYSIVEHKKIGEYCDPRELDLVLTLGADANEHLAPAAEKRGCKVITFDNPYTLGDYLGKVIQPGAVVLVKGSQNRVFAEEAIKSVLANKADARKLVRQSPYWLKVKQRAFSSVKL